MPSSVASVVLPCALAALALCLAASASAQHARDPAEPLRIVGEIPARLERVSTRDGDTVVLTLFFGKIRQVIEPGDELRFLDADRESPQGSLAVVSETRIEPGSGRAHVRVRAGAAGPIDRLAARAPSARPDFPERLVDRDPFVREHGAQIVLVAPFEPEKGDDPANFVRLVDQQTGRAVLAGGEIDPHVSFDVTFNRPVDPSTLGMDAVAIQTNPKAGEPALVPRRVLQLDAEGKTFRFAAPLGLPFFPELDRPDEAGVAPRPDLHLTIASDVRAASGERLESPLELPIRIDRSAKANRVSARIFRVR